MAEARSDENAATDFWLSWYSPTSMAEFELHSPWWVSGYDMDDRNIVVAAVRADDEAAAFAQVRAAYDNGHGPHRGAIHRAADARGSVHGPLSSEEVDGLG